MKTPITELIESINTIISVLPEEALGAKNQAIIIRTKVESLLEKEKEVVTEAYEEGTRYENNKYQGSISYYNSVFNDYNQADA